VRFARIRVFEIGILANNGVMFSESAIKALHFIESVLASATSRCVSVDVSGFMVGTR